MNPKFEFYVASPLRFILSGLFLFSPLGCRQSLVTLNGEYNYSLILETTRRIMRRRNKDEKTLNNRPKSQKNPKYLFLSIWDFQGFCLKP